MIMLLLLLSGNVQPNPGPDMPKPWDTPADFKCRSGLGIIRLLTVLIRAEVLLFTPKKVECLFKAH